jgi:hypothetical protein
MRVSVSASCPTPTKSYGNAAPRQPNPIVQPLLTGEADVFIKSIGRWKFDRLLPLHTLLETSIGKEVEWFSDAVENTIGTIAFSPRERGWNYAVLRRDWSGNFRVYDLRANLCNFDAAKIDFRLAMAAAEENEHSIFHCSSE